MRVKKRKGTSAIRTIVSSRTAVTEDLLRRDEARAREMLPPDREVDARIIPEHYGNLKAFRANREVARKDGEQTKVAVDRILGKARSK